VGISGVLQNVAVLEPRRLVIGALLIPQKALPVYVTTQKLVVLPKMIETGFTSNGIGISMVYPKIKVRCSPFGLGRA